MGVPCPTHLLRLGRWTLEAFAGVHFFVPDVPSTSTLQALGYPPERAAHKARRQSQYVHNKLWRALTILGVSEPGALILDWAALTANPAFTRLHDAVWGAFDADATFRNACLEATRWVLEGPACLLARQPQPRAAPYRRALPAGRLPCSPTPTRSSALTPQCLATTRRQCSWNASIRARTAGSRPAAKGSPSSSRSSGGRGWLRKRLAVGLSPTCCRTHAPRTMPPTTSGRGTRPYL